MRGDWRETTWGTEATLRYGKALKDYRQGLGSTQVFGTNGPVGWTPATALAVGPTPVVGRKGAYRGVHLATGPFWVIDTAYWLESGDALDPLWAYYNLLTVDINAMDSGSAIPSLTRSHFDALPLGLPSLPEQRRIAALLGAFDALIEANGSLVASLDVRGRDLCAAVAADGEWSTIGEMCAVIETGKRPRGGVAGIVDGMPSVGAESITGLGRWDFSKTKYVPSRLCSCDEARPGKRRGRARL